MPDNPPVPAFDRLLATRAVRAAHQRRDDSRADTLARAYRGGQWEEMAHAAAGRLADLLAVCRGQVEISADDTRDYGDQPWSRLTVTDADGEVHHFTAAYNLPGRLYALGPCRTCGQQVPLLEIRSLADYGELLDSYSPDGEEFEPVTEFRGDPGHADTCPHRHHR